MQQIKTNVLDVLSILSAMVNAGLANTQHHIYNAETVEIKDFIILIMEPVIFA